MTSQPDFRINGHSNPTFDDEKYISGRVLFTHNRAIDATMNLVTLFHQSLNFLSRQALKNRIRTERFSHIHPFVTFGL